MAKQIGERRIKGTLDDTNFYRHKYYGDIVRRKPGPTGEKVKKDPAFENTRRHNDEFGRACNYGGTIRKAFRPLIMNLDDGKMHNNLSSRLHELMMDDKISVWGKRDLNRDNLLKFRHFELNSFNLSKQWFELPVETQASNGNLEVATSVCLNRRPLGAKAWKVISVAATVDLKTEKTKTDVQESGIVDFEKGRFAFGFSHNYEEGALLFHGMGIVFYEYDAVIDEYKELERENVNSGFMRFVGQ